VSVAERTLLLPRPSPTSDKTNTNTMRFMVLNPLDEFSRPNSANKHY
jgi:hypothetical protein